MDNKQYTDLLLNQTTDLIWMVDQELQLVYANKAYLNLMKEMTGVEKELNTPALVEGFSEGYIEKWKAFYQRALSGESFTIEEHFFYPGDNQTQYGHISFSPIKDEDGKVLSVACRNTDVTDIVREKYQASTLMDASLDVFCTIDEAGYFVYISAASAEHWGYLPKELIGKPYRDLIVEDDLEKTDLVASEIMAGKPFKSFNNRFRKKHGDIAYNLWSARWDDDAKLMYCVARDAKEKIEEEHQLKLLSSVITNTNDAVLITEAEPVSEPGPRIIYVNEAFTRMTGYTSEEVIGKTPRILQGPKSNKEELAKLGEALRNWQPYEITTINYKKSGEEFWINFTVTPVADETGWYTHWIAIEQDVTAEMNAEMEKTLLAQISTCFREEELNQAGKALCEVIRDFADFDLVELWCPNLQQSQVSRIATYTRFKDFDEKNNSISQFSKGEGLPGKVWKEEKQLLWDKKKIAKHFLRKEEVENAGLAHLLGVPLMDQNQITGVLVLGTTSGNASLQKFSGLLKNLETFIGSEINRKRLENDLRNVYDAIPEILCITDLQGRFLKINDASSELLGFNTDEVLFHPIDQFSLKEDKGVFERKLKQVTDEASVFTFENRLVSRDGEVIWLSWNCHTALSEGLVYASAKNISTEMHLRELNTQAGSMAKIGSWEVDLKKNTVFWSKIMHQLHETDPDTFSPDFENTFNFYREDFKSLVRGSFEKSIATGEEFDYEAVIITQNLKERWVRVIGKAEFVDGKANRIYGSFQDITDKKEAELALIQSEAKFKTIFEIASLGIIQVSPQDGQILLVNSYYEETTGYSLEELLQMKFIDLTHPDDRERDWELFRKAVKGEVEYRNEKRYIKKDGSIIWVRIHLAFIRDEGGNPVKTVAICEDITERKQLESRLTNLSDNLPGVVFQYLLFPDGKDELRSVSKGSYKIWGYSPEEVEQDINLVWDQTKAGGDYDSVKRDIATAVQTRSKWFSQYRSVLPSGEVLVHLGSGTPSYLPDGTILFNSFVMDITNEAKYEELLLEAIEMARIGSWEVNFHNNTILWSEITHQLHDTDPNTFVPDLETSINFYREDFREMVQAHVKACIENGTPFDFEAVIVTTKQKERWVRAIGRAEMINGQCKRIHGSFQDIHDRKIAEIQLKSLTDNLPGVVFQYLLQPDGKDQVLYISEGSYKVWGLSPDECKRTPEKIWQQIEAGGYKEEVVNSIMESAQNLTPWFAEWKNVSLDGAIKWYEGRGLPQRLPDGVVLWNSLVIDITEKKEIEDKYQQSQAERATILESISDGFYALDADWKFTYFNKEAENLVGKRADEVLGGNIWEIFSPAKGTILEDIYRRVAATGQSENFEYHYPGDGCWYEITTYPSAGGVASYFKNIDERRKAALDLEKAYQEKNEILESIGDAFFAVDQEWIVTYWNKQAETILGKKKQEIVGKHLWEEYPDAIDSDFYRNYHKAMESGETITFEEYYPTLEIWVEVTVYPSENGLSVYFKDVTLRKEADKRLLQANERFEKVTEATNDAIWDWDIVNDTLYWGGGFKTLFGYEVDRVTPTLQSWHDHVHPQDVESVLDSIHHCVDSGETYWGEEYRYRRQDGTYAYVIDRGIVIRDSNGKPIQMVGAMTDITELKRANIELTRQAEFINAMTDNQLSAIVACNADGELTLFNKTAKEWHGVDAMKVTQDKWAENYDLYNKDGINLLDKSEIPLVKAFNGEKVKNDEIIIKKKNEKARIVICNGSSFHDHNGEKLGAVVIMTDITERKESEEQILKLKLDAERILNTVSEGIHGVGLDGKITFENPASAKMFGWETNDLVGRPAHETIHHTHPDGTHHIKEECAIYATLQDGKTRHVTDDVFWRKDGSSFPVDFTSSVMRNELGEIIGSIVTFRDITERKKAEKELLAINEKLSIQTKELQRSNEELEQFAFITSHDLQEPLRMISGFMDQLDRKYADQLDDKAKQYIHYAKDGAKRMKQIILDLLLYSRINRPTELQETVNLNEIVSDFLQLRRKLIAEKKADVQVDELPELITYKAPVTQLFHCLLDNALKYSKENVPPVISVQVVDKGDFWEFAFKDNGIGIDEKFYEKIFIIFQRLHNRKDYDGTGIGLSMAKRAVEFLGGEIWIDSKVDEGTTFYFTISKTTNHTT